MLSNGMVTNANTTGWYRSLQRPALTPPGWLFPPVWTVLYLSMGVSAWMVWRRVEVGMERKRAALRVWGWQLLANAVWPPVFFGLHRMDVGLAVIVVLLGGIGLTVREFWPIQRAAALLLVPYLAWVGFATYLNVGFWRLNLG